MRPPRLQLCLGLFALAAGIADPTARAQSGPDGTATNDDVVAGLLANRPRGERVLIMPKLFESLTDVSTEQTAKSTPAGMAAWRDTFGKDGDDEYALRQFFVPMKAWQKQTAEDLLDEAAKQLTEGSGTVLLAKKKYELDGCPCRSFLLRHPETGKWIRVDYLVIYPDLFTVSYTGTVAGIQNSKVVGFFNGLKTAPAPAPKPAAP